MKRLAILLLILFLFSCKPSRSKHRYYPQARKLADSAVQLWYKDDTVKSKRSVLVLDSIFYLKKISLLNKAISIDSTYLPAYWDKFDYQKELRQYDSVIITGKQILKITPDAASTALRIGECYEVLGDTISSTKYYKSALSIFNKKLNNTNLDDVGNRLGELDKAVDLILLRQTQEGRDVLQKLSDAVTDEREKQLYQWYMYKSRSDLVKRMMP